MGTQAEFYGGSIRLSISADQKLSRVRAWSWQITATTGGLAVQLPDARRLIKGYPVIQVVNEGATAFAIEDFGGSTLIATVAQDEVYAFALFANDDADGDWEWGQWTQGGASGPPAVVYPWTLGGNDAGMIQSAWRYDFVADSWSEPGGLSSSASHSFSAGFEVNGEGFVSDDTSPTQLTENFDPSTWTTVTGRGKDSQDAAGAKHLTDDKGYVSGRTAVTGAEDFDQYDVGDDAWTALTDMSDARHKHAAQAGQSTNVLYHGGATTFTALHDATTHMRSYDIAGDSHSSLTSSTLDRLYYSSALDGDGDFWAYGGGEDSNGPERDDVEQYDVSGDSWSAETSSPQGAHWQGGACRIVANGYNYTIGGAGATANDDAVYQHNPANDTYLAVTDHGASSTNARAIGQGNTVSLTD